MNNESAKLRFYLSFLFGCLLLFFSGPVSAQTSTPCVQAVENVTMQGARYRQITLSGEKECDLYVVARNFPQLGEDGKPLPIQQQLRSIKAANDKLMKGKSGLRPVHSACVPDSVPWTDQTVAERDMCQNLRVNYYPVTKQVLVPRVPEFSESEQIQTLGDEACKALSGMANPTPEIKRVLAECQKHFTDVAIPSPSITAEQLELANARVEIAALNKLTSEQNNELAVLKTDKVQLTEAKSVFSLLTLLFAFLCVIATTIAVRSTIKQHKLRDLAHIAIMQIEDRVKKELEKRKAGPTLDEYQSFLNDYTSAQAKLQIEVGEKATLSQQLADMKQEMESRSAAALMAKAELADRVEKLSAKSAKLMQKVLTLNADCEKANAQIGELGAKNAELKHQNDTLFLQLVKLYEKERSVREEHLQKLNDSVELARKAIVQLESRLHVYVKNEENEKAESLLAKLESLHKVLAMSVAERDARQRAYGIILENNPQQNDPTRFLFELQSKDDTASVDRLGSIAALNIELRDLNTNLSRESPDVLDELVQTRRENAELNGLWRALVTGIARAMQLNLSAIAEMEPEQQAEQLALGIGELKMQKLTSSDLAEKVGLLQDQLSDVKNHNAALRKAMESDPSREAVAAYEYTALAAEVSKASLAKRLEEAESSLEEAKLTNRRLQESVRSKDASGLLALEAPELAILPTERIMQMVQAGILALQQKSGALSEAEVVVSSDQELGALHGFLHLPLVSTHSYKLPPTLLTNMGPLQVFHVSHETCSLAPVIAKSVSTQTLRPSAQPATVGDLRKQTLQGLGTMQDILAMRPPRVPEFEELSDEEKDDKPAH